MDYNYSENGRLCSRQAMIVYDLVDFKEVTMPLGDQDVEVIQIKLSDYRKFLAQEIPVRQQPNISLDHMQRLILADEI